MSCGFATPTIGLPSVGVDIPSPPELPSAPSFPLDLDIAIAVAFFLAFIGLDIPSMPELPSMPSLPLDVLGIEFALALLLAIIGVDIPSLPDLPTFPSIPCPMDELV